MKYFYDTEFIEGKQERPLILKGRLGNWMIGKPKPTIDLISIGIVDEDGVEYYAISKDFNLKEAWNRFDLKEQTPFEKQNGFEGQKVYWIRENVLYPIFYELYKEHNELDPDNYFGNLNNFIGAMERKGERFMFKKFKSLLNKYGKTNDEIANEIYHFFNRAPSVELYAYYGAYDHVALMWLYGKMMDRPKNFPMFSYDLKQMQNECARFFHAELFSKETLYLTVNLDNLLKAMKEHPSFPKQENEHNALDDAHWNKKLYNFLIDSPLRSWPKE